MHLVLRAEAARGHWSLLRRENARVVREKLAYFADRWDVKVYEWANGGTHLHLLVRGKTRDGLKNFMRGLSGSLAMAVTGARKGKALGKRFWDLLLFTRVVAWGKAFKMVRAYIVRHFLPQKEKQKIPTSNQAPPKISLAPRSRPSRSRGEG